MIGPYEDEGKTGKGGGPMEAISMLAIFALFVALAAALGNDSRDGEDWFIHRPV